MVLGASKLIRCSGQQIRCNFAVSNGGGKQSAAFEKKHECICCGFQRELMDWSAAPSKKLSGQVKSDDAAATVPMVPTTSNHAADDHVHVIGRVAFAGNHRVVSVTDRASPKRENTVLYSLLIATM